MNFSTTFEFIEIHLCVGVCVYIYNEYFILSDSVSMLYNQEMWPGHAFTLDL